MSDWHEFSRGKGVMKTPSVNTHRRRRKRPPKASAEDGRGHTTRRGSPPPSTRRGRRLEATQRFSLDDWLQVTDDE